LNTRISEYRDDLGAAMKMDKDMDMAESDEAKNG